MFMIPFENVKDISFKVDFSCLASSPIVIRQKGGRIAVIRR
jgi:hypothetical protein